MTYCQLPLCRWHCRKCRRGRRSWRPGRPSWYNHHKVQNRDRPRQDKIDNKQPKWLPKRDQDKMSEVRRSTLEQSSPTKDQNPRFFPGYPRQQQLFLDWRSYGGTRTSRLLLRLNWCERSSYLPSFMPVRAGPWQQKSREGSKPLRWDAIGNFLTFPTKTMWQTRRFATESRMQLECMMIS